MTTVNHQFAIEITADEVVNYHNAYNIAHISIAKINSSFWKCKHEDIQDKQL